MTLPFNDDPTESAKRILPERCRLLLVDDDALDRQAIIRGLRRDAMELDGIETDIAEAGTLAQAREALQLEEFSCLFLDYNLPDGTSLDLIAEMPGLNTPFIVLTGQQDERAIVEVMRAGAADYLTKDNLSPGLLGRTLRSALRLADVQREHRKAHQQTAAILERITDAFFALDAEWRFTYVNDQADKIMSLKREQVMGRSFWEVFPHLNGTAFDQQYHRAVTEQVSVSFETFYSRLNAWLEVRAYPSEDGLSVFFQDVTERREAENALRRSREDLQFAVAAAQLGTFYCDWPLDKIVWNDICKEHFFLPPDAEVDIALFYSLLHPDDRETTRRAIERAMAEHVEYDVEYRTMAPDGRTRWINAVGRFYYNDEGSPTRFDGVTLDISERRRTQEALARMADEHRARAEREVLINRIGASLRGFADLEAAQETAASLLGAALGADRCYFAVYDLRAGTVRIARDWHREDLPSVCGTYPFANTVAMFQELYQGSHASVIADAYTVPLSAQTLANMESLQIRARVSVALADADGLAATLTAAMADAPRAWTAEEVALVEAAATQLRIGVEAARVQQREHRIATQLQEALQPDLPGAVPGLAVAKYYEAALTGEAGVGGDFYDVFGVEKGRTALVVGDLSGKGLAAAAQVSIVRNMLRAFLYTRPVVAEAATELNRVLAENNLLTGFTTLFVGVYDSGTHELSYVNCGQEPALVRRGTTAAVERLPPTGPILGSIENAVYTEETVTLAPGDALAIFSDGLTEIGPSRTNMFGVEGVATLFGVPEASASTETAAETAERLVQRLIAGVNAVGSGGVMRDDMCLLVAVIEG